MTTVPWDQRYHYTEALVSEQHPVAGRVWYRVVAKHNVDGRFVAELSYASAPVGEP